LSRSFATGAEVNNPQKKSDSFEGFRAVSSHCRETTLLRGQIMSNAATVEALFFAALEKETGAEQAA